MPLTPPSLFWKLPFDTGLGGNPALSMDGASGADLNGRGLFRRRIWPASELRVPGTGVADRRKFLAKIVLSLDEQSTIRYA